MTRFEAESLDALPPLVGRELAVGDWFEITQERISRFADVTEDRQWIHVDEERARTESPYGGTVAHGFLTLSLLPHLCSECMVVRGVRMGVNYGLNRVRFMAPVPAGSRVRARLELRACERLPGGMQVVMQVTVEVEGSDKPACVAELVSRRYA